MRRTRGLKLRTVSERIRAVADELGDRNPSGFRKLPIWLAISLLLTPALLFAADSSRVVLVLDGSNSMWGRIDGTEKIVVARQVLSEMLVELPKGIEVGLAAYGHRREGDCDDIELLLPPGEHPNASVEEHIRSVQPRGMTPITAALQQVAEQLPITDVPTHLVLISDGKETCDGDPCAMARALHQRGIRLSVHVVGFDVSAEERKQLECIAREGGGTFASADSALELAEALTEIRDKVVRAAADPTPRFPTEPDTADRSTPWWRLDTGDSFYEGDIAFTRDRDQQLQVHLVNKDAVNVGLLFPAAGAGEPADDAFFAVGRDTPCRKVASKKPFAVRLDSRSDGWLKGTFTGTLACGSEVTEVVGAFRVPEPKQ